VYVHFYTRPQKPNHNPVPNLNLNKKACWLAKVYSNSHKHSHSVTYSTT